MGKHIKVICIILIEVLLIYSHVLAKQNYLIIIGNEKYSAKDFKWWWEHWKNPGQPLIKNLDPYIKWLLFLKEAKKMKIDEDPIYKRKLLIFRKVRDLLRLQYEEVESKFHITEDELKKFYIKNFTPIFQIKSFYFNKKKEALNFRSKLNSVDDCERIFKNYKYGKANFRARPWNFPKKIREIFYKVNRPQIVGPFQWSKVWTVVCVEKVEKGNEKDFKKIKGSLREILKRIKEGEFTDKLIARLKRKYKVILNKDLLKKVNLNGFPKNIRNKIILKIENRFLTVGEFYKMLKREAKLRWTIVNRNDPKSVERFKEFVINSIIAQNLVDIEALNRGYEKKEPLKSQYEFYKKNLLVKGFIGYVILPRVKVTDSEMRKYYEKYKKDYGITETIRAVVVETDEMPLIDKINEERKKGKTLESVLKEFGFKNFIVEKDINDFSSKIRNILNSMKPGDIKEVKMGKRFYLIKLINKKVNKGYTYEKLKFHIRQILERKKFEEEMNKIYRLLKKEYGVKINYREWERVRRELSQKEHIKG